MIFCLHLLAHHQKIQDEARESIKKILDRHDGNWSYDAVMEMSFVEQIIEGKKIIKSKKKSMKNTSLVFLFYYTRNTEALSACK